MYEEGTTESGRRSCRKFAESSPERLPLGRGASRCLEVVSYHGLI